MNRHEALEWTWLFLVGALGLILFGSWVQILKCWLKQIWADEDCWQSCLAFAFIVTIIIGGAIAAIILTRYPQQ